MPLPTFLDMFRPLLLLSISAFFLPHTLYNLFTSSQPFPTSWSAFKNHWFARFWIYFGPNSRDHSAPLVKPLLTHATGTVLDIGSGQGHWLCLYDTQRINKLLAVEPNRSHHPQLLKNAQAAGFIPGRNFEILDCLVETLESHGNVKRKSIDTIVTLQVLCSVPDPQSLIPELRTYLKPKGGRWIVTEHVRCKPARNGIVSVWQGALNYVWPEFFNGCQLTRETKEWIEATGGWSTTEGDGGKLGYAKGDSEWTAIPTVSGWLVSDM